MAVEVLEQLRSISGQQSKIRRMREKLALFRQVHVISWWFVAYSGHHVRRKKTCLVCHSLPVIHHKAYYIKSLILLLYQIFRIFTGIQD